MPARVGESRTCETCGVQIVFLRHGRTGKLAPIEVVPNRTGRFTVNWTDHTYSTVFQFKDPGEDYYRNHYETCPQAKFWRDRSAVQTSE